MRLIRAALLVVVAALAAPAAAEVKDATATGFTASRWLGLGGMVTIRSSPLIFLPMTC